MTFEDFQHLARLSVVGALDLEELASFEAGLRRFGERGEEYVRECRRAEAALALSLDPAPLRVDAKERLLEKLRNGRG